MVQAVKQFADFTKAFFTFRIVVLFNGPRVNVILFVPVREMREARGGAVGGGTALQAGRSRVRFPMEYWDFSLT